MNATASPSSHAHLKQGLFASFEAFNNLYLLAGPHSAQPINGVYLRRGHGTGISKGTISELGDQNAYVAHISGIETLPVGQYQAHELDEIRARLTAGMDPRDLFLIMQLDFASVRASKGAYVSFGAGGSVMSLGN